MQQEPHIYFTYRPKIHGMLVQLRFKSVYAFGQSDQSLSCPPEETLDPWLPIECPSETLI